MKSPYLSMNLFVRLPEPSCPPKPKKPKFVKPKKPCKRHPRKRRHRPVFPCPPKNHRRCVPVKEMRSISYCPPPQPPPSPPTPPPPLPPIIPVIPIDPVKPANNIIIDKECCGSILIQGVQPDFQIWENDVIAMINLVQISITSSASSTQPLEVLIEGNEQKKLTVPPGSTINYIGQRVLAVIIPSQGNELTYVEGRYAISISIRLTG
nr:S-Ena type endospore appendage [Paenibacillus albus]